MFLQSARLADGSIVNVRVSTTIDAVGADLTPEPDEEIIDLGERLLLTAFAEPHAHLDKAFLSERILNPTGDLMGAIMAMRGNRELITLEDTIERAERAVRLLVSNGTTTIRSHADTTLENTRFPPVERLPP